MQRSRTQLKQIVASLFILIITSPGLVSAADNSGFTNDRMQNFSFNSKNQATTDKPPTIVNQTKDFSANKPKQTLLSSSSKATDKLPVYILAFVIVGLAILLLIPGKYIRKPINIDENQDQSLDSTTGKNDENIEEYIEYLEAEDEIEQQLDAEEELESIEPKIQGKIVGRDKKYNNRVAIRRKR